MPPFFDMSFLIKLNALMAKAILPKKTALTATMAMIPRKIGMRAANLSFNSRRRGNSFLSFFFFFLPRPGTINYVSIKITKLRRNGILGSYILKRAGRDDSLLINVSEDNHGFQKEIFKTY